MYICLQLDNRRICLHLHKSIHNLDSLWTLIICVLVIIYIARWNVQSSFIPILLHRSIPLAEYISVVNCFIPALASLTFVLTCIFSSRLRVASNIHTTYFEIYLACTHRANILKKRYFFLERSVKLNSQNPVLNAGVPALPLISEDEYCAISVSSNLRAHTNYM